MALSQGFSVFCGYVDPFKNFMNFRIFSAESAKESHAHNLTHYLGGFYGLLKLSISMSLMIGLIMHQAEISLPKCPEHKRPFKIGCTKNGSTSDSESIRTESNRIDF